MPPTVSKKKPTGKREIREASSPEGSLLNPPGDSSEPRTAAEPTPKQSTQTALQGSVNTTDTRTQFEQDASNAIGATVRLTDEQFRILLERLAPVVRNLPVPTTELSQEPQPKPHRVQQPPPGGDPSDSSSGGMSHRSYRNRRSRPRRWYDTPIPSERRSPKHDDPDKLDDGTSPTYVAWRSLLRGKLSANADWWPTEQDRIYYVFSRTEGKAQSYLEPRINEDSLEPWLTVEDMLTHLDTIFRNHFEAEQSENAFYALKQSAGQDFNDFHTEFARLASVGRVPSLTWRSHLWRKLNREFQNRLLATHHQHPTYPGLVRECQRLSVDLEEFHRQFPPVAQSPRQRTIAVARTSGSALRLPAGMLPAPKRFSGPFRALPAPDKQDSTTPGPRSSPTPADPSKATCFNCGEVGHFASSCPNPRTSPRINEIEQEDVETLSDRVNNDEADADSESEN